MLVHGLRMDCVPASRPRKLVNIQMKPSTASGSTETLRSHQNLGVRNELGSWNSGCSGKARGVARMYLKAQVHLCGHTITGNA